MHGHVTRRSEEYQKGEIQAETFHFRPITDEEMEFLYRLYASTRLAEMAVTGWGESQVEAFLRMQFGLQHSQYMQNYPGASFEIVFIDGMPAGRLYVDRKEEATRLIDIALLPEFKGKGTGGRILRGLVEEADAKGVVISLHVEMNNPILPFYKTLGFREIEQRGIYYYMERRVANGGKDA
jgi:ribosomal protein S18 acetylase RimI-like enzyme